MSVYNTEKYLSEAIESILNQTYSDFEFIIIDDGSTDKSLEIIQQYAQKDKRIRVILNKENIGLAKSLNKGIAQAKGKYIARMDADDISLSVRLQVQFNFLESNPEISVVGSNYTQIDSNGIKSHASNRPCSPARVWWGLFFDNMIAHPTVMMSRSIFTDGGIQYNEQVSVAQDFELWHQVIKKYDISNLADALLLYRVHNNSVSESKKSERKNKGLITVKKSAQAYVNFSLPESFGWAMLRDIKAITTVSEAHDISRAIVSLYKHVRSHYPEMSKADKSFINNDCAKKLIKIWQTTYRHIRLFPILIFATILNPKIAIKACLHKSKN